MSKMKMNPVPGFWLLLALTVLAFPAYPFEYEHNIKRTFTLTPGQSFQLVTLRGSVEIRTHKKDEVFIDAELLSNNRLTRSEKHIQFESTTSGLKVSSSALIGSRANVRYDIRVPESLQSVYIITRSGKIKARGRYKDIRLSTGSGNINFRGEFRQGVLQSANGDMDISVRKLLAGDLTVESANGSISIALKKGSQFTIDGKTLTGSIRSKFRPLLIKKTVGHTMISGTVGNGAHKIRVSVVNGNIILRKR